MLRRYQCVDCSRTVSVGPRLMIRRRLYDRARIAVVLVLWGFRKETLRTLRNVYSAQRLHAPGGEHNWPMVRRWVRQSRRIFGKKCPEADGPVRSVAHRIAKWILSHAPSDEGMTLAERTDFAVRSGAF